MNIRRIILTAVLAGLTSLTACGDTDHRGECPPPGHWVTKTYPGEWEEQYDYDQYDNPVKTDESVWREGFTVDHCIKP